MATAFCSRELVHRSDALFSDCQTLRPSWTVAATGSRSAPNWQPYDGASLSRPEEQSRLQIRASINNRHLSPGAGSRVRTDDLLITNQLLYQLSYAGFCLAGGRLVAILPLLNRILRDPLIRYPAQD
jgi:hypothetical protein